jgi:hypothetical protein
MGLGGDNHPLPGARQACGLRTPATPNLRGSPCSPLSTTPADAARGDDQRVERASQRLPRRGLRRAHRPRLREHARRGARRAHDLPGLVLTPLVFLGLVAFVRCLEIAIDDWELVTRITRLQCTYDQLVPELAPLMSQAVADDGLVAMLSPRWQPFQKMLSVAVIISVVVGGDAGVIVFWLAACCTWPSPSAPQPERSPSDGRAGISGATGVRRPGRRPETSPPAEPLARTSDRCHELGRPRTSSPGCCGLRASPVDMAAWQLGPVMPAGED